MMKNFELKCDYSPSGDQPQAIKQLIAGVESGKKDQVLLGVTGSGKTFTMACVIERLNRPALILAHNKTLAAQLYGEFKELFPYNEVGYFVSYYDYYQPEAYLPVSDTYIEKDSSINEQIDRLRHAATHSLWSRRDVIIVSSVSCIYGLGSPQWYRKMKIDIKKGDQLERQKLLELLVGINYDRNDLDFHRGVFRVRGDVVEVFPAYEEKRALRIEYWDDEIERISWVDPLSGSFIQEVESTAVFPGSHYVTDQDNLSRAMLEIKKELKDRLDWLGGKQRLLESQRLQQRTNYDLEMMKEVGYCSGIENYSRYLENRPPGSPPSTLLDHFPQDFLLFVDESHMTIPQVKGMYRGDRSRKETLIRHGFRLPSALDNRPLTFDEFESRRGQTIYVSATPADYELSLVSGKTVQQIIRPTGLIDPEIEVRPAENQVDDLLVTIKERVKKDQRVLVTTLTKRMAEDLSDHLEESGIFSKYLHSDIPTLERTGIIRDLRLGKFQVLVGVNLLREGLDIPEVSLVAVLDADKEGFLRSERSLIQTCGRAARNLEGKVILYGSSITDSMRGALAETRRRRARQQKYNQEQGITPESIKKGINDILGSIYEKDHSTIPLVAEESSPFIAPAELPEKLEALEKKMIRLAREYRFEQAAQVRDELFQLREQVLGFEGE